MNLEILYRANLDNWIIAIENDPATAFVVPGDGAAGGDALRAFARAMEQGQQEAIDVAADQLPGFDVENSLRNTDAIDFQDDVIFTADEETLFEEIVEAGTELASAMMA